MDRYFLGGGSKYFANMNRLLAYQRCEPHHVVTADISPTSKCNLACEYCMLQHRQPGEIDFDVLQRYIRILAVYGLRGVLFTGGGEPTLYQHLQEAIKSAWALGIKVGLITNGCRLEELNTSMLDWVRISWHEQPAPKVVAHEGMLVGVSATATSARSINMRELRGFADAVGAKYVKIIVDGFVRSPERASIEDLLSAEVAVFGDERFMVHRLATGAPKCSVCHRAQFRPYLSEVDGGTVFPCGLIPFEDGAERMFSRRFALCKADEIGSFLRGEIKQQFDARRDCSMCQCADVVGRLDEIKNPTMQHSQWV